MPKISYIVSAYKRPEMLRCCLASLAVQTDQDFEVIVADNAPPYEQPKANRLIVQLFDERFSHTDTDCVKTCAGWDCYHSAEYIAALYSVKSEWLCFPSDDSYYMPTFQQKMIAALENQQTAAFAYCDWVSNYAAYHAVIAAPRISRIDKTGFIVRRSVFNTFGFPMKSKDKLESIACDGYFIEKLMNEGYVGTKVNEILMVHN